MTAARLTRLYVLTRDAYLSPPVITTGKLAALAELRRAASGPAGRAMGEVGLPAEIGSVPGVRLVELLRVAMSDLTSRMGSDARAVALLDVLVGTTPPGGFGWSASPIHLTCDAAGYLAPEVSTLQIHRLAKAHRASRRLLTTGARFGLSSRALLADPTGPETAVADMLSEVLGMGIATARCAAIVLIDGGSIDSGSGLAGGMVLDPLRGFHGPDAFVGTALGRAHPMALMHELAGLECVLRLRPTLKTVVAGAMEALREDLATAQARTAEEALRMRASRRAVELALVRMGTNQRGPLGAFTARRHQTRPGYVTPTPG
ncbi:MAG: hypothetical protein Q4P32_05805 [Micrococcales bacterium]|nr:hypothetical protein [Micrococcales bacterium]